MREALKKVGPTQFGDIVASSPCTGRGRCATPRLRAASAILLGPLPGRRLRSITEATYGCCIYQEQLMEIAKRLAGFSGAEADDLRKAIGKKKRA